MNLTLLVLGHQAEAFKGCPTGRYIRHVYLPHLNPNCSMAESRIFHAGLIHEVETDYLGLCTQRWDEKYRGHCRPLAALHELPLAANVVWAAATADGDWLRYSDSMHGGMADVMHRFVRSLGRRPEELNGRAFWSNNFIAAREVVRGLTMFQRQFMHWFLATYGPGNAYYPKPNPNQIDRTLAFLLERVTMAYFRLCQQRLEIKQIPL